jgi:hypothetical protein
MRKSPVGPVLAALLAVLLVGPLVSNTKAIAATPGGLNGLPHQSLVQPVIVWRDCQRIARCYGCRPVFHCRTCSYQRQCRRGPCQWGDVCVWGPFVPVAPRGVPVY